MLCLAIGIMVGSVLVAGIIKNSWDSHHESEHADQWGTKAALARKASDLSPSIGGLKVSFPQGPDSDEASSSPDPACIVHYDGLLPSGFKFHWAYGMDESSRSAVVAQSVVGQEALDALPYGTEILVNGDGGISFSTPLYEGPRDRLAVTEQLLEQTIVMVRDYLARGEDSVPRALGMLAQSGRAGALEFLIEHYRNEASTEEILSFIRRNTSKSSLAEPRLVVAMLVDQDYEEVVRAATNKKVSAHYRKRACEALIVRGHEEYIIDVLQQPPFGMEVELINRLQKPESSPRAQDALMKMLETDDHDIMLAAAKAFQRIGTRDAVMPLQAYLEKWGIASELKDALEIAVQRIQERLEISGNRGGLCIVAQDDKAGELSLSSEQKGRVALAKQKGAIKSS